MKRARFWLIFFPLFALVWLAAWALYWTGSQNVHEQTRSRIKTETEDVQMINPIIDEQLQIPTNQNSDL